MPLICLWRAPGGQACTARAWRRAEGLAALARACAGGCTPPVGRSSLARVLGTAEERSKRQLGATKVLALAMLQRALCLHGRAAHATADPRPGRPTAWPSRRNTHTQMPIRCRCAQQLLTVACRSHVRLPPRTPLTATGATPRRGQSAAVAPEPSAPPTCQQLPATSCSLSIAHAGKAGWLNKGGDVHAGGRRSTWKRRRVSAPLNCFASSAHPSLISLDCTDKPAAAQFRRGASQLSLALAQAPSAPRPALGQAMVDLEQAEQLLEGGGGTDVGSGSNGAAPRASLAAPPSRPSLVQHIVDEVC